MMTVRWINEYKKISLLELLKQTIEINQIVQEKLKIILKINTLNLNYFLSTK
jgi:hypothetical protein